MEKINKDNASMLLTNRNLYYNIQDKTITTSCNCTEKKIPLNTITNFSISTSKFMNIYIAINNQAIGLFTARVSASYLKPKLEKLFNIVVMMNLAS